MPFGSENVLDMDLERRPSASDLHAKSRRHAPKSPHPVSFDTAPGELHVRPRSINPGPISLKVIEKTATRLLVRHMPWLLGGLLFLIGAAALIVAISEVGSTDDIVEPFFIGLIGVGTLLFGWWFAPVVELDFDREAGLLRFSEIRLYRRRDRDFPLTPQIRVGQQADYDEDARLTRLVLRTANGVVPLERGYGSGDRNAIEAEINAWLAETPPAGARPPAPPRKPAPEGAVRRRR